MARNFVGIPPFARVGLPEGTIASMSAVVENVELLTGQRGDPERSAVTQGQVRVARMPVFSINSLDAKGVGVSISGTDVPTLADYGSLVGDVAKVTTAVRLVHETLNALIISLKGQ